MDSELKNLIYGCSDLERIVNIECKDKTAEIFQELEDGTIKSSIIDNAYWLLSNVPLDNKFNRLNGDLFFKYDKQYTTRDDFVKDRNNYRKYSTFSIWEERESLMVIDGYTYYKGMKPKDVSVLAFDIETTGLDPKAKDAKVLLISNTYRKNGIITRKLFAFDEYESEGAMLTDWCTWVYIMNPSLMIGHNIFGFDLNYLYMRARILGGELSLGRDGSSLTKGKYEKQFRVDGSRDLGFHDFRIYGRECLDTMQLAIKSDVSRRYSSYGLKSIIKEEGWEKEGRTFYDASKIRHNYKDPLEFSKIKTYCSEDGDDSLKLFDKLIPPFWYALNSVPKPMQSFMQSASGSQLNSILVRSYLQNGHSLPNKTEVKEFPGAICHGIPGIHSNVLSFDVSSLYPSIMLQYEIYDKIKDPNKNLLKILKFFTEYRFENKRLAKSTGLKYYDDIQAASKIFINSIYGCQGAPGLIFNSPENASLVTKYGREVLMKAIKWATNKEYNEWKLENN